MNHNQQEQIEDIKQAIRVRRDQLNLLRRQQAALRREDNLINKKIGIIEREILSLADLPAKMNNGNGEHYENVDDRPFVAVQQTFTR
jgi:hypothetical protein